LLPSSLFTHLPPPSLQIEDWSFVEALYWALVTITTVGFGDVVPETHGGKAFTIFFCLVGCTALAWSVNNLIRYPLVVKAKQSELRVMMQFGGQLSEETLLSMLANDFFDRIPHLRQSDESVTKSEFILLLLSMMSKINDKDVLIVSKIFDMLDEQKQSERQIPLPSSPLPLSLSLSLSVSPVADILSAENLLSEIKKAQEREEAERAEQEIRERKFSSAARSPNSDFLHVRSLKNISSSLRTKAKTKSGHHRSTASPSSFSASTGTYNPLNSSTHEVRRQLHSPLVSHGGEGIDDTNSGANDDLNDTYLPPSSPSSLRSESPHITRLFRSPTTVTPRRPSPALLPPTPSPAPNELRGTFKEKEQQE
jgi:hypothetical protein